MGGTGNADIDATADGAHDIDASADTGNDLILGTDKLALGNSLGGAAGQGGFVPSSAQNFYSTVTGATLRQAAAAAIAGA